MSTAAKPSKPGNSASEGGQGNQGQNAGQNTGQNAGMQAMKQSAMDQSDANKDSLEQELGDLREDFQTLVDEVGTSVTTYFRKRPGVAACALFTLGFYVGWKIKPW